MEQKLFDVINDCLNRNADLRPTMENIIRMLTPREDFMFTRSEASDSILLFDPTYHSSSEVSTEHGLDLSEGILNVSETGDCETFSNIYTEYFEPKSSVVPTTQDQNTRLAAAEVTPEVEVTDRSDEENGSYQDASTAPKEVFSESNSQYSQYHLTASNEDYESHTYQPFYAGSGAGAISVPQSEDVILRAKSSDISHQRPTSAGSEFFDHIQAGALHGRSHENVTNIRRKFQMLRPFQSTYMLHLSQQLSNEKSAYDYMKRTPQSHIQEDV